MLLLACADPNLPKDSRPGDSPAPIEDSPPAAGPPILADYDAEPREDAPRSDGYTHVDSATLVQRLLDVHVNTYAFLLYHSPSDWDDLAEYLALAEPAGIDTWVYLVPPTELPSPYPPYEDDYVAWARAVGELAATHPSVKALAIDDFNSNVALFTGDYVCAMMDAAHAAAPELKFYAVEYYPSVLGDLASEESRRCIDGVMFAYTDLDDNGELRAQIDAVAAMRESADATLTVSFPWETASEAGAYGRYTAECAAGELSFAYSDNFASATAGYHVLRVREEGVVRFEEDVAGDDVSSVGLSLGGGTVSVGIEEAAGVSNFGVVAQLSGFSAPSCGDWTWEATDSAFTGSFGATEGWPEMELIPMIYATSTSWHAELPTTGIIAEAVGIALDATTDGTARGVITYCLDKSEGSESAAAVGELYAAWGG